MQNIYCLCILFVVWVSLCDARSYYKRDQSVEREYPALVVGIDEYALYYVNATLGNPEQLQRLRIDLAQPFLWTPASDQCTSDSSTTCEISYFNSTISDTCLVYQGGSEFEYQGIDYIYINGSLYTDYLGFPNLSQKDQFALFDFNEDGKLLTEFTSNDLKVANASFVNTNFSSGLVYGSLGLAAKETFQNSSQAGIHFPDSFFFLDLLSDLEVINNPSYSLWLGGDNSTYLGRLDTAANPNPNVGTLIFGAVDPDLFIGDLIQLNILPYQDPTTNALTYGRPIVPMGPVYIVADSGASLNVTTKNYLSPTLLDSRINACFLPVEAIIEIAIQIEASYIEAMDYWVVDCTIADKNVNLDFLFGNITISAPLADFLNQAVDSDNNLAMRLSNGKPACYLNLFPQSDIGFNVLGGPFLKSAYFAVDNAGNKIALSQAKKLEQILDLVNLSNDSSSLSNSSPSSTSLLESFSTVISTINTTKRTTRTKKNTSSSTQETLKGIAPIKSGTIPYAYPYNMTDTSTLVLVPQPLTNSNVTYPIAFTAVLYSDGLISQQRSFFDTERTTASPRSTSSQFASLSLKAPSNITSSRKTAAMANRVLPPKFYTETTQANISMKLALLISAAILPLLLF